MRHSRTEIDLSEDAIAWMQLCMGATGNREIQSNKSIEVGAAANSVAAAVGHVLLNVSPLVVLHGQHFAECFALFFSFLVSANAV